jgi:Fe-S cluster assembly protein SufB
MSTPSQLNLIPTRTLYDDANLDQSKYKSEPGLTEDVVREISKQKNEPAWMLEKRLQAFEFYKKPTCRRGGRT